MLSVQDVVKVTVSLSPIAAAMRGFGTLLILGDAPVIDTNERLRPYSNITAVANDFGLDSEEYKAAAIYFMQNPQPTNLMIGRWAKTVTAGCLNGQALSTSEAILTNFTQVNNGKLTISIDGAQKTVIADFSSAKNLNGVASLLTQKLGNATCIWDDTNNRFIVSSNSKGTASSVTAASDTLASLLKLDQGTSVQGALGESLKDAVLAMMNKSMAWYGLYISTKGVAISDYVDVAKLIEASYPSRILGITTQSKLALEKRDNSDWLTFVDQPEGTNAITSGDLPFALSELRLARTFCQYSGTEPHAAVSIFGRAFTVNFQGSNTTITVKFKQEPGIAADDLTVTQANNLRAKNCNMFALYDNGTAIIQEGVMSNGDFFDERHGLDWLQNDVQTAVWNYQYTTQTKIPQTDAGMTDLQGVVESRLMQAKTNQLLGAGIWNGDGFGGLKKGDYLPKGFYTWFPSIDTQSQEEHEKRKATPIQCAAKLAGAIHYSDILISVNR